MEAVINQYTEQAQAWAIANPVLAVVRVTHE